jgi:hypothetical protein
MQPRIPPAHKTDIFFLYSHGSGDGIYHNKIWNNIYRKMAPDDLHTVFGGVLGKHFINVLTKVGNQLDMGKDKFLQVTNTLFDAALVSTGSTE